MVVGPGELSHRVGSTLTTDAASYIGLADDRGAYISMSINGTFYGHRPMN